MSGDQKPGTRRLIGFALFGSALMLALLATLMWTGGIPIASESRGLVAGVVGAVAGADAILAVFFILTDRS